MPGARPTLSIIIPTAGRDTLPFCLQSIAQQELIDGDEVLIIGDGPQKDVEAQVEAIGRPFRYIEGPHTSDWGHSQINKGIELAKGDYIAYQDDDDSYFPRAFEVIRARLEAKPGCPHIFRFFTNDHHLVWRARDNGQVEDTLLGGHNLVIPNRPGFRGEGGWTERYRGDLDWVRAVLDSYPKRDWQWNLEILTRQRPDKTLAWWAVRTPEQFEALRVLRNECREDMTHFTEEITPVQQAMFAKHVQEGSDHWPFLFSIREEEFAYCGWMLLRRIEGKMWLSYGIGKNFRGRGLARHIFLAAIDAAMEDAFVDVAESNKTSLHIHHEMGWIETDAKNGLRYLWHEYPPA